MASIGLFPLGMVLLPGEVVPLHIFEPRYKELIAECLDGDGYFGLVWDDEGGMRGVGTYAAVVDVLERFADGRLNILVEGRGRFRIREMTEGRSFATAEVDDVSDEPGEPDPGELERCLQAYRKLARAAGVDPVPVEGPWPISYRVAAHIGLELDIKQELLEEPSESSRLARVTMLLTRSLQITDLRRTARERATGNGLVDHL